MNAVIAPIRHGGALAGVRHKFRYLKVSLSLVLAIVITAAVTVFLRVTKLGTAMRALANDREITATLGVPVRRPEGLVAKFTVVAVAIAEEVLDAPARLIERVVLEVEPNVAR